MLPASRLEGSGPQLVCHPGGPGYDARYLRDLGGLDASRTLVLVDPRGTGATPAPDDPRAYTTEDYVADLEELRASLGADEIDLLGHSHGTIVGIAYAARYPGRVRRLVLASPLARFGDPQQRAMEEAMATRAVEPWYEDARAALEAEQAGDFADDDELQELVRRELPFYVAALDGRERAFLDDFIGARSNRDALKLFNEETFTTFDLRPELPQIAARTLVLTGEQDFITGPVPAREVADGIPCAELVLIPECGHFPFVEQPESFRAAVEAFLAA